MKIPNAEHAVISRAKLFDYLLNVGHRRGGAKARLLVSVGYQREAWQLLEHDLREQHLGEDVAAMSRSDYGVRYEIVAPISTPSGETLSFRSIWQIDAGTDTPRLITMYPE